MSYKPFLIVFFTSIGLNKAEAGLLVGLMPLGSILGNPFWGIIADKTKRHRTILIIQFLGAMTLMSLQPFVAKFLGNPVTNRCPLAKIDHGSRTFPGFQNVTFSGSIPYSWTNGSVSANRFAQKVNVSTPGRFPGNLVRSNHPLPPWSTNSNLPGSNDQKQRLTTALFPSNWLLSNVSNNRRKAHVNNALVNVTSDNNRTSTINQSSSSVGTPTGYHAFHKQHDQNMVQEHKEQGTAYVEEIKNDQLDSQEADQKDREKPLTEDKEEGVAYVEEIKIDQQDSREADQSDREKALTDKDHKLLFTVLLAMIVLQDFFQGSYLSFTESAAIRYIDMQPYRMDYGFQRMVSGPGAALGVPMVNLWLELMAKFGWSFSMSCYVTMHVQYTVASLLYLSVLLFLYGRISPSVNGYESIDEVSVEEGGEHGIEENSISQRSPKSCCKSGITNRKKTRKMLNDEKCPSIHIAIFRKLTQPQMLFLLVTLLFAGVSLTLFYSFTMAYLIELGASRTLLSLAYSTALMSLMLGYFFSTRLIAFFKGPWNVFLIGFAAYTVRYLMYGFMRNPWLVLSVQPLHLLNRAVLNAAAITYVRDVTSPEILTSVYAIMDSVQTGVGWIVGNSFGGYVYHVYGGRVLYVSVACLDMLWVLVIFVFSRRSKLCKLRNTTPASKVIPNGHSGKNHGKTIVS